MARARPSKPPAADWPCRHPGCERRDGTLGTHRCAEHRIPYEPEPEIPRPIQQLGLFDGVDASYPDLG